MKATTKTITIPSRDTSIPTESLEETKTTINVPSFTKSITSNSSTLTESLTETESRTTFSLTESTSTETTATFSPTVSITLSSEAINNELVF